MDRRTAMSEMYADDVNAFLGLDHSHMGFWSPTNVEDFPEAQEEYLRRLCRQLNLKSGDRVLDVGGGQAGTAVWLVQHYDVDVVVVDIVEEMVEAGRRRVAAAGLSDRISCMTLDFLDLDLGLDTTFDAIVAVESLYHMTDLARVFKRFANLLDVGGRFVVSTYVSELRPGWLKDQYLMLTVGQKDIPHLSEYRDAIREAGLCLEEAEDVSESVLPGSTERLQCEPYVTSLREYHVLHFGRLVGYLLPVFFLAHKWVMKREGLKVVFLSGRT